MKIKTDFVTNSSSTSFVVMRKGSILLDDFIKAIGVDKNSRFYDIYVELYHLCTHGLAPYYENMTGYHLTSANKERIKRALEEGYEVLVGELHSDDSAIELYFCTSQFLIKADNFIIDGTSDGW